MSANNGERLTWTLSPAVTGCVSSLLMVALLWITVPFARPSSIRRSMLTEAVAPTAMESMAHRTPLANPLVVLAAGVLIYRETLTPLQTVGVFLAFAGVLLINWR
jgi:drug/metabolite transporter (DMT)-like permease